MTELAEDAKKYLKWITKYVSSGKRKAEIDMLRLIIDGGNIDRNMFDGNALNVLDGSFYKNGVSIINTRNDTIAISADFQRFMEDRFFRDQIEQVLELGEYNWSKSYMQEDDGFVLYMRYTYDDVCRLLNWPKNFNGQILSGYFYHEATNTFPVFIVAESQYNDRFVNRGILIASSKPGDGSSSKRMKIISNSSNNGVKILLFMSKDKGDKGSKEFYYLGRMDFVRFLDDNKPVSIEYRLRNEVRADLYEYFQAKM